MIDQDHQRFRQIVKGRIRGDLRKFLTRGELIGKEGKRVGTAVLSFMQAFARI